MMFGFGRAGSPRRLAALLDGRLGDPPLPGRLQKPYAPSPSSLHESQSRRYFVNASPAFLRPRDLTHLQSVLLFKDSSPAHERRLARMAAPISLVDARRVPSE